ncbi:Protein EFR3 B [Phlyctochytrium planicorne]|nr:Protein EFR3 B [Phlyctochytrium planicorne]
MAACCGRFFNHVTLINNVYPSEPGEVGPKSSSLSLLVFYASSKPQKLEKVGIYLERKLKQDARRNRNGYLKVTLDIVNALIDNCATHINLISKSILRIISDIVGNPDPELFLQATTTFVKFCAVHSHDATLDKEFSDLFSSLVDKFCGFASYETHDQILQQKMHLSGLKAIKAVVSSDTFQLVPHLDSYISKIVPAILTNIKNKKKKALLAAAAASRHRISTEEEPIAMTTEPASTGADASSATSVPPSPAKRISITDELFTDSEVEHSAEASLSDLISSSSSVSTVRLILSKIFDYLDSNKEWASTSYVVHIVRVVAVSAQPQHRYILLSSVLELLDSETFTATSGDSAKTDSFRNSLGAKITLVRSLSLLIATGGGTVGLAVMELVDALVRQLLASVKSVGKFLPALETEHLVVGGTTAYGDASSAPASQAPLMFQIALIRSVSALAVSLEYPDQLNDILSFVINRLRVSISTPTSGTAPADGAILTEERKALLRCLVGVILARYDTINSGSTKNPIVGNANLPPVPQVVVSENSNEVSKKLSMSLSSVQKRLSTFSRSPISLSLLYPLLELLEDPDADIRVSVARFLHHTLALEAAECGPMFLASTDAAATAPDNLKRIAVEFLNGVHAKVFARISAWAGPMGREGTVTLQAEPVPAEYLIFGNLLAVLQRRFLTEAVATAVPLVFRLQNIAIGPSTSKLADEALSAHRRATSNFVLEHLLNAARSHSLTNLVDTLVRLRDQRIEAGEWYTANTTSLQASATTSVVSSPILSNQPHTLDAVLELACPVRNNPRLESLEDLSTVAQGRNAPSKRLAIDRETCVASLLEDPFISNIGGSIGAAKEKLNVEYVVPDSLPSQLPEVVGSVDQPEGAKGIDIRRNLLGTSPGSVRTASIQRSDAAGATPVKVDDLKEVLAGASPALSNSRPHSTDPAAGPASGPLENDSIGVVSIVSAEKSRSNVKVLLRNISVSMDSAKRSASPSLQPLSSEPFARISTESPRTRSEATTPSPTLSYANVPYLGGNNKKFQQQQSVNPSPLPQFSVTATTTPPSGTSQMIAPSSPIAIVQPQNGTSLLSTSSGSPPPQAASVGHGQPISSLGRSPAGVLGGARYLRTVPSNSSLTSLRLAEPSVGAF